MPAARVAGAALLLSLAASAARAANCTVTVSSASANFQFNTSGDLTYGSIPEVAANISAMNCSGVTSNYLFVHSNNKYFQYGRPRHRAAQRRDDAVDCLPGAPGHQQQQGRMG